MEQFYNVLTVFLLVLATSSARVIKQSDYEKVLVSNIQNELNNEKICENCVPDEPLQSFNFLKITPYISTHLFQLFDFKKFLDRLEHGNKAHLYCMSCKFGVSLLKHYIHKGATEDDIGKLANRICTMFHIETERVCDGISNLFKSEITNVLMQVAFSPKEICGIMLGKTCYADVNPLHNWTVPLTPFPKPPVKPILPPKSGAPVTRVLHISDTHLDPYYQEGSLANCGEPLCCRATSGKARNAKEAAGYWGDYGNCDIPLRTLENMLDHINRTHRIDYVIWTGDIPPHDVWNNSREEASYLIHACSKLIQKYLGHVPIFPALGNHESSPVNSFPVPQVRGNESIEWLYNELVHAWGSWFSPDVSITLKRGAFYSVPVHPGFRIISINMNYCNNMNWWLLINSTDPAGELEWLVKELQLAEIKGEKVHIIGHIPPGNFDCLRVWSHNYYNIIKRYESTVTAQFFGHTHTDEFELFYDTEVYTPKSRAFSVAYIGPSITTYDGLNPGYRIYTIDGNYANSSRVVLDHETYIMNLTLANASNKTEYHLEYSARNAYGMKSLLPEDWNELVKTFESNDKLFQQFFRYYVKLSDYHKKTCDNDCKKGLLCNLRKGSSAEGLCIPSV